VLYLNNSLIDPNQLSEKVKNELDNNPNSLVVLEADQNVTHGKVVRIMDLIKKGGAERIAIATKPRQD
jgi:biopolymer transport protein ExbD